MGESVKLTVIICTYNRADLLQGALQSLDDQFFPKRDYQVLVVDDGSTDHTSEVARRSKLSTRVEYLPIEHAGRAAARNHGVKNADGDFILFVDDDILAPPNLLEEHYILHKKFKRLVVRGPIINIPEYTIPLDKSVTWRDYSTAFFCTCNASTSKFALIQAGGFDESFTEYGFEDNELGWRLRERGYTMKFNPEAIIYHYKPLQGRESHAEMVQRAQELGRSAVRYYEKHPHWQVGMATGLHPLLRPWNALVGSDFLNGSALRKWDQQGDSLSPQERAKLEHQIFKYHYLRSLDAERQRIEAEKSNPGARSPSSAGGARRGGARAYSRESEVAHQDLGADVHVQPEVPPRKGPGRSF